MIRTPVTTRLPKVLVRNAPIERTPVVRGQLVPRLSDLLARGGGTLDEDVDSFVEAAGAAGDDDRIWSHTTAQMLKTSLMLFASEILRGNPRPPYEGRFLLGTHHLEWDELVALYDRILIQSARDHGKSYSFSFAYPLWKACYQAPGSLGYLFSSTEDLAQHLLRFVARELMENPKLERFLPATGGREWNNREITLRNGSTIVARGMSGARRGPHPDWIVGDDMLDDDDIYSETVRNRHIDFFLSSVAPMCAPGGQIIVVGTPMHQADLYWALEASGRYHSARYPAIKADGTALWPDRYNLEALRLKKQELRSEARFAREFLCKPLTDEASLFPSKLFEGSEVRLPYILGLPASYWERQGMLRYTGVDNAMSNEVGADYFVIFTLALDQYGNRWLANLRRAKGLAFHSQIDMIVDEYHLMRPEVVFIESNQAQRVWTDEVSRRYGIPVRRFFTIGVGGRQPLTPWKRGATNVVVNKHHIDRGVPGIRISLENKKWRIPRGDAHSIELTDTWIGEMQAMSWQNGKVVSVGQHDDTVMAMWMADTAAKLGNIRLDWVEPEQRVGPPPSVLAAPPAQVVAEGYKAIQEAGQAERAALASVQNGLPVEVSADNYFTNVRESLNNYAAAAVQMGENTRAARAVAEVSRLDAMFRAERERAGSGPGNGNGSGNGNSAVLLAPSDLGGYRANDREPPEGAPTPHDLGID